MHFTGREEAGRLLAAKLEKFKDNAAVFGLPRGGIVPAAEVALAIDAPLSLIISRKIGHPNNPEYAICAVTETGPLLCNEYEKANVSKGWLAKAEAKERSEAKRRRQTYLEDRQPISARGKTAIIVDDGIATGLTIKAAIAEVKTQNPAKIVVAVPVAPRDVAEEIKPEVDEFIALDAPVDYLGAVGSYYDYFPQLTDEEVIELLNKAE